LSISACGFSPVYKEGSKTGESIRKITLADPKNEFDFLFANQMQSKIPSADDSSVIMRYDTSFSEETSVDGRNILNGKVSYNLIDISSGVSVLSGQGYATVGYTLLSSSGGYLSTETSRTDAFKRLSEILAQRVYYQMIAKISATDQN